jgi:hypothetical protein
MTITDPALVAAVRAMHDTVFESNETYRKLICATAQINTEGAVYFDEMKALTMMRELAVEAYSASHDDKVAAFSRQVALSKLAHLSEALHVVLLADGLGGSREAGQRHVATVKEERQQDRYETEAARRAYRGLPPLSSWSTKWRTRHASPGATAF